MSASRRDWMRVLFGLAVVAGLYVLVSIPSLYGDFLWFGSVGYESVFLTILTYRIGVFAVVTLSSFAVLYASYRVAARRLMAVTSFTPSLLYPIGMGGLSLLLGSIYSSAWEVVLRFVHATHFDRVEPIYGQDVAFYVYQLPFYNLLIGYLLLLAGLGLILAIVLYGRHFAVTQRETATGQTVIEYDLLTFLSNLRAHAYDHLLAYIGVLLILTGVGYYIDRFELLYSRRGAVFGLGATEATVIQPLLILLAITGVIGGLIILANTRFRDDRAVYIPIAMLIGFLVLGQAASFVYQDFVVEPDEFNKEERYLEEEIAFTNQAFALDRIDEQEFPVDDTLTRAEIEENPGTIDNVRLWDPRPLLTTYNELQIFRTYYTFTDVDVDRYEIDGQERQVMISAREIDFEALPSESQTWVNRHLVYTHGFGVVMSPVSKTTGEGLPELWVKNIPPNSSVGIEIDQPRIYYGESTDTYAIVDSQTRELDYPSGGENVYTRYDGSGGVQLSSSVRELIYTAKFGAPSIFLSDSVTSESRIQFNRDIQTRARTIAPFLEYDRDPYIVVSNGRLYWIYDAYTTTNQYPYSRRINFKGESTNYVRNSVKVVIDAHSGETTYYVADDTDPLVQTYQKAFPSLFEDLDAMPRDLRRHIRYPEDSFSVQAMMYLDYHMRDPQVFYNKEDAWRIPDEVARGEQIPMDPYYIIMKFPDAESPEFVMIQPYIPRGRQNMIGWLAARSDPPNYGTFRAFLFSKQQLTLGPMQIESRIDQDADISQQITLWSQSGSSVLRGNLLAIPIEDTIIYVEPLFLESQEQGALPELKRVILAQGDSVIMQPTLDGALEVRFGAAPEAPGAPGGGIPAAELQRLQTIYAEAQTALREGDFETYGERITELGEALDELEARQTGNTTGS